MNILDREHHALIHTYDRLKIGTVDRAEGCYIYTTDGKRYLDVIAGLGVNALGHSHPRVVEAIREQAGKYLHLSNLYYQEPQIELAERLKRASGWDKVFWTNSGTEAVEGALKLARKFFEGKRSGLIGLENGFHGRTYGPLSVMDKEKYRQGYGPFLPGGSTVEISVEALTKAVSSGTAVVILESIQGEGGIYEIKPEFVEALHRLREQHGFLIIADEIQSGMGRTGTFFAYEQFGLKPDIVVIAKAIGGGLPLGGILTSDRVAQAFSPGVHGTTFGGNVLCCAAGIVVMDELASGLMEHVKQIGASLKEKLSALKSEFPEAVVDVRGKGLMLAVEVADKAKELQQDLLEHGIIINVTHVNSLRLLPPLILTQAEADELVMGIRGAFGRIFPVETSHFSQQMV